MAPTWGGTWCASTRRPSPSSTPRREREAASTWTSPWLLRGQETPLCALTDRPPEDLARKARGSLLGQVLTLKEVFVPLNQRHGLVERPLPPDRVPERAYVACLYGAEAPRPEALGPLVLDLYPARLVRREPQSVEVLRAEAGPTELVFQVRLHPCPWGTSPWTSTPWTRPGFRAGSGWWPSPTTALTATPPSPATP